MWTAETPNLYQVELTLASATGERWHSTVERFGFRTIEVRAGDGVYVNGKRIVLKGANRHTFWPTSGRASSPRLARLDIGLMKDMNMNAVRMSHYPPDAFFLDLCDELGLYVLDELTGWQHRYDEGVGAPLVKAMVDRDVNHPSILFWDNGNEGGWNTALDDDFGQYDPQRRAVLHPWTTFSGIDTSHYQTYGSTASKVAGGTIFMPTEFLHGLYDGGAGAGLNDYWKLMGGVAAFGGRVHLGARRRKCRAGRPRRGPRHQRQPRSRRHPRPVPRKRRQLLHDQGHLVAGPAGQSRVLRLGFPGFVRQDGEARQPVRLHEPPDVPVQLAAARVPRAR